MVVNHESAEQCLLITLLDPDVPDVEVASAQYPLGPDGSHLAELVFGLE